MAGVEAKAPDGRSGRGCWYEIYIHECPLCGATTEYRKRRWTKKPAAEKRYHYYMDSACPNHFL